MATKKPRESKIKANIPEETREHYKKAREEMREAMKGLLPDEEIAVLPENWRVARSREIHVPELGAQRHLLVLEKLSS